MLAVILLMLVPALDLMSGSGGDGDSCPLHASPAVLAQAVSVPIVTGTQVGFVPAAPELLPSERHAIFVPPRA